MCCMKLPYLSCIVIYLFSFALMSVVMCQMILPADALMMVGPMFDSALMLFVAPIPIAIALLLAEFDIQSKQSAVSQRKARLFRFSFLLLTMTALGVWLFPTIAQGATPEFQSDLRLYIASSIVVASLVTWLRYVIWALSQEERTQ